MTTMSSPGSMAALKLVDAALEMPSSGDTAGLVAATVDAYTGLSESEQMRLLSMLALTVVVLVERIPEGDRFELAASFLSLGAGL